MSGADYKYSREYGILFNSGSSTVAAGLNRYYSLGQHTGAFQVENVVPHAGIISRLNCYSQVPPGVGESFTYTLFVNGAVTVLTCVIAGAVAQYAEDLVNEVPVQRGNRIVIQVQTTGAAVATVHSSGMMMRRT